MRKLGVWVLCVALAPVVVCGQNLVSNGSFEDHLNCPDNWNQVGGNVTGWNVCGPESPDYFNACRDTNDFSVPSNLVGFQAAYDGQAYVGVGTYQVNAWSFREFVCAQLSQPLQVGVPVYLSMRVAMGIGGSTVNVGPRWASRGIGMRFTMQPFEWPWPNIVYPNDAHLFLDDVLVDSVNWIALSEWYTPDSAYEYVTIGNFFNDSLSTPEQVDVSQGWQAAYAYVDDVCIGQQISDCSGAEGLGEVRQSDGFLVMSLFSEELPIEFLGAAPNGYDIGLYDLGGQQVLRAVLGADQRKVALSTVHLANGAYLLTARSPQGGSYSALVVRVSP